MKNIVKFIIFIIFTVAVFFIEDLKIIGLIFLFNCIIAILLKIKLRDIFYNLKLFIPFIIFTAVINIVFSGLYEGILIGIRIIICYSITYIYSKTVTIVEISDTIQKLLYPLKIFKIDTNNIGIMISISICMIPILKNEIYTLKNAMKSKGKLLKINTMIIVIKPILISILNKTKEMEKALISKAYM